MGNNNFLKYAGCVIRVHLPERVARVFIEQFPFRRDDEILPSSKQTGSKHDYLIYVNRHAPYDDQLDNLLAFPQRYKLPADTTYEGFWWTVTPEQRLAQRYTLFKNSNILARDGV